MNNLDFSKNYLKASIERIIFNEEELKNLKIVINELNIGTIESKKIKDIIIKSRMRILDELVDFIPFCLNLDTRKHHNKKLNALPDTPNIDKTDELEQKNQFLELIGERINNIYKNLKEISRIG
ncbi:MAG: hypothetical protein ACFFAO_20335 [Candidatus Hermodarchaeota archaeon]